MEPRKKEFVMRQVIKDVHSMENGKMNSVKEEHFNIPWCIQYARVNENFSFSLKILARGSIEAETTLRVISTNGTVLAIEKSVIVKYNPHRIEWYELLHLYTFDDSLETYVVDGKVMIEAHVVIKEMSGCVKENLRAFDESVADCSDVVLVVKERKFYLSKMFLAVQSPFFKALLLGSFNESKQSEVVLKDIEPDDFQNYLELIHGESSVEDNTVEGILHISDMYDTPTATRRCEEFLLQGSKKLLKEKLGLSCRYKLKTLKKTCLSGIKSVEEFRSAVPSNLEELDQPEVVDLMKKLLELH